jgi:hypothetical protein
MPAFTIRLDNELIEDLDELFPLLGFKSRNQFLEHLAKEAVAKGFVPAEVGQGYLVQTPGGGRFSLIQQAGFVSSGGSGLTPAEETLFQRARELVSDGRWYEAKHHLQAADLEIRYIT